jgi:hypothetical protein
MTAILMILSAMGGGLIAVLCILFVLWLGSLCDERNQ